MPFEWMKKISSTAHLVDFQIDSRLIQLKRISFHLPMEGFLNPTTYFRSLSACLPSVNIFLLFRNFIKDSKCKIPTSILRCACFANFRCRFTKSDRISACLASDWMKMALSICVFPRIHTSDENAGHKNRFTLMPQSSCHQHKCAGKKCGRATCLFVENVSHSLKRWTSTLFLSHFFFTHARRYSRLGEYYPHISMFSRGFCLFSHLLLPPSWVKLPENHAHEWRYY